MIRKYNLFLDKWLSQSSRKPLVLRGARQIGKTYLVENWARSRFSSYVRVDLERERGLHSLFDSSDPFKILQEIFLIKKQRLVEKESFLFLDEIQACPKALAVLRYFYELMPEFPVVAAGSLLDFTLREFEYSMPVGRIEYFHMGPLTFEEFLEAVEGKEWADYYRQISVDNPPSEAMDKRFKEALRNYYFVGGMPEAVQAFSQKAGFIDVQRIQNSILDTMQDDFAKYAPRRQQDLMRRCLGYAAQHAGRKVKYTNISPEDRAAEVKAALMNLARSSVIHLVFHSSGNAIPLGAEKNERRFKLLFLDIGLMNRFCDFPLADLSDLITANEGMLAEQFVGQELLSSGFPFESPQLYHWRREEKNANAEVDYLIQLSQEVVPVEVKAGTGRAMLSLKQFLKEKKSSIAIRLYAGPIAQHVISIPTKESEKKVRTLSLPLYLASRIKEPLFNQVK